MCEGVYAFYAFYALVCMSLCVLFVGMYVPTQAHRIYLLFQLAVMQIYDVLVCCTPASGWRTSSKSQHVEGVVVHLCATAVADEALLCVSGALQGLFV